MTFDEWKEYTKAALELAGDVDPGSLAGIVMAAIGKHVMMPSDLEDMQRHRGAVAAQGLPAAIGGAVTGRLAPKIG